MSSFLDCLSSDSKEGSPEQEKLLSGDQTQQSRAMSRDETVPPSIQVIQQRQLSINDIPWSNTLTFYLNGTTIELHNPNPSTLLAHYIRDTAGLHGTKLGCEEGGCGACTVSLTKKEGTRSVNSCLRPLCANDGMGIMTVEGIGSIKTGLSVEQQSIVENNGTQCGYCTPGWVANMHALNESKAENGTTSMSEKEVENYFDGNICRCTGYRPIMKAAFSATAACPSACPGKQSGTPCHHGVGPLNSGCGGNKGESSPMVAIEDLAVGSKSKSKVAAKCTPLGSRRNKELVNKHQPQPLRFQDPSSGDTWYRPVTFEQMCTVIRETSQVSPQAQIQFIGGNTSIGVTKYLNQSAPYNTADAYDVFVDINDILELQQESFDVSTRQLTVGSAKTLSELMAMLNQYGNSGATGEDVDHSSVFSVTSRHLGLIANTQVRNAGSWAGNLGIFNRHQSFPSDAVLALTLAQATLTVSDMAGQLSTLTMDQFLQLPPDAFLSNSTAVTTECLIIVAVTIQESQPPTAGARSLVTESYKICVRDHNAHAQVNAGFSFVLDAPKERGGGAHGGLGYQSAVNIGRGQLAARPRRGASAAPVCLSARIVYGGVSNKTFVATRTQQVFANATMSSAVLQQALVALQNDLMESGGGISAGFGDPEYRVSVMQTCLYRSVLRCYGAENLPPNLRSVLLPFEKPPSSGIELFDETGTGPLHKAVIKLEAKAQSTGEARYASDEPLPAQGLCAAMVYTTQASGKIKSIDPAVALGMPGVVSFLSAKDIPGTNFVGNIALKLFLDIGDDAACIGNPVGMIIASTPQLANDAQRFVRVTYEVTSSTPDLITNLTDSIAKQAFYDLGELPGTTLIECGDVNSALESAPYRSKGSTRTSGQSHFYMECQTAISHRKDGEFYEITCGTQNPTGVQKFVSNLLGIPNHHVTVNCPRVGGGFGGKINHSTSTAAASCLASSITGRPVKIFNSRTSDMYQNSGREDLQFDYEVGYTSEGLITAVTYDIYVDAGMDAGDATGSLNMCMNWADNGYHLPNYRAQAKVCFTNTPSRTYCRAPGVVQSALATSVIVERVAMELGMDIEEVQHKNLLQNGDKTIIGQEVQDSTLEQCWQTLLQRSNFKARQAQVEQYNKDNLWRKRGIAVEPVKYGIEWAGYDAGVQLGVYRADGTVSVTHSASEIGQGVNTKVAQTVATALNLPLDMVRILVTSTDKLANGGSTGGSATSEVCCQAAVLACEKLLARLNAVADPNRTVAQWVELVKSTPCDVSMNVEGWYSPTQNPSGEHFQYFVWGACVSEVELDVLSGQVHTLSSEILYDCGQSLNPDVDIGQIEGGFVMGLGYICQERVQYDEKGLLDSVGTWEYKPPLAQDIPSVLNVTLLANAPNRQGILRSKAVGEPSFVLSNSIYFGIKTAIMSARRDQGNSSGRPQRGAAATFVDIPVPMTIDVRQQACLVDPSRFVVPN
eukprot:CAMPEP_0114426424 /NCGR_PEP_ID=MMETSP0103-20121206/7793_1 /TAXON_ID=37642 ORGANISM="Paraphysomonas imperforata, Strain PA2" /NCGR_SAMPLE_ID=MMETSP0103 /ASSEMBLY_ACC=CAM_ASM_000201 /LENGTH=1459 /DNA_ID=CAMNT_0001595389 /DNA_START=56 /DNA_END=4435 /DNA_ORIENTATION=-